MPVLPILFQRTPSTEHSAWVSWGEGPSWPERTTQPLCGYPVSIALSEVPLGWARQPELVYVGEAQALRGAVARFLADNLVLSFAIADSVYLDIGAPAPRANVRDASQEEPPHIEDARLEALSALADPVAEAKARWKAQALRRAAAMAAVMAPPSQDLPSPPTSFDHEDL